MATGGSRETSLRDDLPLTPIHCASAIDLLAVETFPGAACFRTVWPH
jgi:hypothetical protein